MRIPKDFYQHLRSLHFAPVTVFDVGVAWGTPELYEAFPNAYYYLFEALPSFEPSLKSIMKKLKGEYHLVALSSRSSSERIYVGREPIQRAGASVFHREPKPCADVEEIQLRRLDDIMGGKELPGPVLMKIDAQGSDIEVLKGGEETVKQCDLVIVETGLHPFRNEKNQTHRVISYMASQGFATYDFLSPLARPYDKALGQIDVVFVKEDGPLRKYPYWA